MIAYRFFIALFLISQFTQAETKCFSQSDSTSFLIDLVEPSRELALSSCIRYVIDSSRKEITSNDYNFRELNINIWYPSEQIQRNSKIEYFQNANSYTGILEVQIMTYK